MITEQIQFFGFGAKSFDFSFQEEKGGTSFENN